MSSNTVFRFEYKLRDKQKWLWIAKRYMLATCTDSSKKKILENYNLLEENIMVAILNIKWRLSKNEGIRRKYYWTNKDSS